MGRGMSKGKKLIIMTILLVGATKLQALAVELGNPLLKLIANVTILGSVIGIIVVACNRSRSPDAAGPQRIRRGERQPETRQSPD